MSILKVASNSMANDRNNAFLSLDIKLTDVR